MRIVHEWKKNEDGTESLHTEVLGQIFEMHKITPQQLVAVPKEQLEQRTFLAAMEAFYPSKRKELEPILAGIFQLARCKFDAANLTLLARMLRDVETVVYTYPTVDVVHLNPSAPVAVQNA